MPALISVVAATASVVPATLCAKKAPGNRVTFSKNNLKRNFNKITTSPQERTVINLVCF